MNTFTCKRNSEGNAQKLLTIPLDGEDVRVTEKAFGIKINGQMIWLAKSQIKDAEVRDGKFSCWCPMWLITEKSLEIFIDTSFEPSLFEE